MERIAGRVVDSFSISLKMQVDVARRGEASGRDRRCFEVRSKMLFSMRTPVRRVRLSVEENVTS